MVLDAWSASPARFREDANAEEALAVGGYAGRVLVELAANAVDAAIEAGVPPRIRVRVQDGELRVANSGAPLTAAGVASLSSLRASAKRDTVLAVGHFGVGFTAVLSWSAAPRVVSSSGGVRFDPAATAAAIVRMAVPALDREVDRRGGAVPVLRLPWPTGDAEPPPPAGYTTEVRLPLLPAAVPDVQRFLDDPAAAEDLFWALPALTEIDLADHVVRCATDDRGFTVLDDAGQRTVYRTAHLAGPIPPELLADRPVEERRRASWQVTWALPTDAAESVTGSFGAGPDPFGAGPDPFGSPFPGRPAATRWTVGAPTPTDEPLTVPARLIGTFPVDDTRRRLAPGPLCDYLLQRAADCYLELIAAADPGERWTLFPVGGFPAGPVDGDLREAILRRIDVTPLLITAAGDLVAPGQACVLPGQGEAGARLFGQAVPGLLLPQPAAALEVLRRVGVDELSWAQASTAMASIDRGPEFWWQVYDAVATAERPPGADDLADLPVPLSGGRRVLGARGCLLPAAAPAAGRPPGGRDEPHRGRPMLEGSGLDPDLARRCAEIIPGLRIVDPAAAHPYLRRLGARPADADTVLADPALAAALDRMRADLEEVDPDPDDVRELAVLVLDLLAAGGRAARATGSVPPRPGAMGALPGELILTTDDGQPWPAPELLLPGAALASVLAADADRPTVGGEWLERYPPDVLAAAGVRSGFAVLVLDEPADPAAEPDLPDFDEWLAQADPVALRRQLTALADLDVVDPHRWPQALQLIAADPAARECLLQGPLSYSGWWLSRYGRIDGRPPGFWRLPEAAELDGLYDPLTVPLDGRLARAIGVRADLAGAAAADPQDLLDRLADPARTVPAARVAAVTAAAVTALAEVDDPDLPAGVRTLSGAIRDADGVLVLDVPWLAQVLDPDRLVPGGADPALVARVLDLPLASAEAGIRVHPSPPGEGPHGAADRLRRAAQAAALDPDTAGIVAVPELSVVVDGAPARVRWWADGPRVDRFLTDGSADGAGRAAAWAAGRWELRHLAVAAASGDAAALAEESVRSSPADQIRSSNAI